VLGLASSASALLVPCQSSFGFFLQPNGIYAVQGTGTVGGLPAIREAVVVFDGQGNAALTGILNVNGTLRTLALSGRVTVDAACFITIAFGTVNPWIGVFISDKELSTMTTGPDALISDRFTLLRHQTAFTRFID